MYATTKNVFTLHTSIQFLRSHKCFTTTSHEVSPSHSEPLTPTTRTTSNVQRSPENWFMSARQEILTNIKEGVNDRSLAGAIDPRVRPIVDWINYHTFPQERPASLPCPPSSAFVTSSSCSGRILVFHREDDPRVQRDKKRGSIGLGKLIETHDPIDDVKDAVQSLFLPTLNAISEKKRSRLFEKRLIKVKNEKDLPFETSHSIAQRQTELLHLQFRPMILHVIVRNMSAAKQLLDCAYASGQNASSILSCSKFQQVNVDKNDAKNISTSGCSIDSYSSGDLQNHSTVQDVPLKITCCITSSILMDVPLKSNLSWIFGGPPSSSFTLMPQQREELSRMSVKDVFTDKRRTNSYPSCDPSVDHWTPFLEHCLLHGNNLFRENFARMDRFFEEIKKRLSSPT